SGKKLIAEERDFEAIGGTGRDVDRALSTKNLGETGDLAVAQSHEPQLHVFVSRMAGDVLLIREEDHRLAIRRDVGEPVVEAVEGDLLLGAAVGVHAPDLHAAGALGVEVNVLAIGRIFGTIVEALGSSEARFFTSAHRDDVDVELAIALGTVSKSLAVGRPAMPVRR